MAATTFETSAKVKREIAKTIEDVRKYWTPFAASQEYLTRILTDALTGDVEAYRELRGASIHHHQYRQICDAIKEKYGHKDYGSNNTK